MWVQVERLLYYISAFVANEGRWVMLRVKVEREDDGRWIADVVDLPGVLAYGQTREEAVERAKALSLRVLADRLEHGEEVPEMGEVFAVQP
jgi:predicted RNase H-like HicB family nuclease